MRALERRADAGEPLDTIASVASFFVSRIDVLIDQLLEQRIAQGKPPGEPDPQKLLGRAGVANAKLAYRRFKQILGSARWKALSGKGARVQRLLWASTSTKNPAYPDLMYVEPLIGPLTINTMPRKTLEAFRDHGRVQGATIEKDVEDAERVIAELERLGVSFDQVTAQLEDEGIQKFIKPFDAVLKQLASQREKALAPATLLRGIP